MSKIKTVVAVAGIGGVIALAGCGSGSGTLATVKASAPLATIAQAPSTSPRATQTTAADVTTAARAAPPSPAGPAESFGGDGTYVVGTDIAPGTYKSAGGPSCYWARLKDLSGNDILANNISAGPAVVTVLPGDAALKVSDCARWTLAPGIQPQPAAGGDDQPAPAVTSGGSDDETYRGVLRSTGVFFPSDEEAIAEGQLACSMYSSGSTNAAVARQVVSDFPALTNADALNVERAATAAYCKEFS